MLSAAVDSYLAGRRAAGFQLNDHEGILRDFAYFASTKGEILVRTQTVLEWIRARDVSPLRQCVRLRTVVHFARYVQAEDPRHEVPPDDACGRHRLRRRPPFLFTPRHVKALVREARALSPAGSLQPLVYSTLLGLLASTGLRISEALNLQLEDVTPEGLVVRNSKFGKSRLLPLHPTTRKALEHYIERRCQEAGACVYLFPSMKGQKLHANTVRHVFRRLVLSLGIARREDKPRPRLHDLRFFFANQALTNCSDDHKGISRHMVALTTYLGHSDVRNSYWYLEATPKLLSRIAESCEDFVNGGSQ
jgi:integrase/recombinase XerD